MLLARIGAGLLAVTLAGCSGHGTESSNVPSMAGAWNGQRTQAWTTDRGPGGQTCSEIWIVTGQAGSGEFVGTMTSTGPSASCSYAGFVDGRVDQFGNVSLESPLAFANCFLLGGSQTFSGVVSQSGGLTARRQYEMRCASERGPIDYRMLETYLMDRR